MSESELSNATYKCCITINELVKRSIVSRGFIPVKVVKVVDGDTLWFAVEHNGDIVRFKTRFARIDTCEVRDVDPIKKALAYKAKKVIHDLCMDEMIYIEVIKLGNFKRFIAEIYIPNSRWDDTQMRSVRPIGKSFAKYGKTINGVNHTNVSDWMLENRLATLYVKG